MKNFRIGDWINKLTKPRYSNGERGQSADNSTENLQDPRENRNRGAPTRAQTREARFSGRGN